MYTRVHIHFKFGHVVQLFTCSVQVDMMHPSLSTLSNSMPMDATEDSSPCNSVLMNLLSARDRLRLEQEERATARLQCRSQRESKVIRADRGKARLD